MPLGTWTTQALGGFGSSTPDNHPGVHRIVGQQQQRASGARPIWAGNNWQPPHGPPAPTMGQWGNIASRGMQGAATPNPMLEWLRRQAAAQNSYTNSQMAALANQAAQANAFASSQANQLRQQQAVQGELFTNQQQGLAIQQRNTLGQHNYNTALATLQQQLASQQIGLAGDAVDELGRNMQSLIGLLDRGMGQTTQFINQQRELDNQITQQAMNWLGQQGAFNQEDLALTKQAIANVLQTQTERFRELNTATRNQRGLSTRGRDQTLKQAGGIRDLSLRDAAFQADRTSRLTQSDAIARGAMGSEGFGDDMGDIATQLDLSQDAANFQYGSTVDDAQLKFDTEMESIRSALADGRIGMDDARRQAADARQRADLSYRTNTASLANQRANARLTHQGNQQGLSNALAEAQIAYERQREQTWHSYNQGFNQYEQGLAAYNSGTQQHNLQMQEFDRAYNSTVEQYNNEIRRLDLLRRQGRGDYTAQINQLYAQANQQIAALNAQRQALSGWRM